MYLKIKNEVGPGDSIYPILAKLEDGGFEEESYKIMDVITHMRRVAQYLSVELSGMKQEEALRTRKFDGLKDSSQLTDDAEAWATEVEGTENWSPNE